MGTLFSARVVTQTLLFSVSYTDTKTFIRRVMMEHVNTFQKAVLVGLALMTIAAPAFLILAAIVSKLIEQQ